MSKIMLWITEKSPDESYRLIPKFIVKNNLHFNFLFVTFTPYYYPTFTAIMIQKTHSSALPFIYVFVMLLYTQIHTQLLLHARVQNSRNVFPSDGFKVGGMGWVFLVWMLKITDCITMEWRERAKLTAMMVDVSFIILPFQSQIHSLSQCYDDDDDDLYSAHVHILIPFNETSTLCISTQTPHTLISHITLLPICWNMTSSFFPI